MAQLAAENSLKDNNNPSIQSFHCEVINELPVSIVRKVSEGTARNVLSKEKDCQKSLSRSKTGLLLDKVGIAAPTLRDCARFWLIDRRKKLWFTSHTRCALTKNLGI